MADRKKVADKGNESVSDAMTDGEKVARNKSAASTGITETDGKKQNFANADINERKGMEKTEAEAGDESTTEVTNEDGTTVRISKVRTESGKIIIKKTIVRKVAKPKTEGEAEVAASKVVDAPKQTEVENKADDKSESEKAKEQDSKKKDSDKSNNDVAQSEQDKSESKKEKKEKKSKDKKEKDKKSKEIESEEETDSKEKAAEKKVADEKESEENPALIEKQRKKLEAQQKKQEEADAKKALKEKLKNFKETPFVNFEASADDGLNDSQVEERELRGMTNRVDNSISKSYLKIFTTNIFTLFNLLNIFLACLIIIFNGQIKNMLFAGIAMINLVIGIIQEIRSKRALDKLSLVSAPSIEAVRNGQVVEISTDEIVIDDIIILKQGSQIPTDCIVVGGECEANESLLTGEQDDIHKGYGDQLMSGSFVQSGKCRARVIAVGEDTYASKLMSEAKKFKKSKSELMRSINWIIRIATIIIFPLGILMFMTNMKYATSISGAVTSTVSSVIGMIPEGLVMLTSVALALGIVRLAKKRTLVQDLYSIEALARVDVLCLDKTGTITEGSMQVESVHVYSSKFGSPDDIMANLVKALG
ncbi:MAG: HAD-IC family P-type ATPase, partial [Clostridia bacterium]|nr:HAD-IC family P-type ATPase [Clostridia bacterium]